MNRVNRIFLVIVVLIISTNLKTNAQAIDYCDDCIENGQRKPWSGPYIYEEVYVNNGQRWDVVYMTRSCTRNDKVELHFKVVGIKSPTTPPGASWVGLQSLMPPIHDYLLGNESIQSELVKHSMSLSQGETMTVRLYQSRCWMFDECQTTECYDNTQELTYPCGPPCCEYSFDVQKVCSDENSNFLVTDNIPVSLDGLGPYNNCPEQQDPDVCKPPVCNPTTQLHQCTSNYGGCIPYYHTRK